MIIEINNKTRSRVDLVLVRRVVDKFFYNHHITKGEVSVAFVGDQTIRKLNRIYRGLDKVTDVLAFEGERDDLGEVLIDYAQVKRQAKKFNNSIKQELVFILVHGLLHLLGHDDKTAKGREEMAKLGAGLIKKLKLN